MDKEEEPDYIEPYDEIVEKSRKKKTEFNLE